VPLLAEAIRPHLPAAAVVVSPDLGAVKLADAYATALGLPVAVVHKTRLSGTAVVARSIIGELRGRSPLIIDDMVSTGETIGRAADAARAAGASPDLYIAATHGPLVAGALSVLAGLGVTHMVATDSVPPPGPAPFPKDTISLAPLLADAIRRLVARDVLASGPEASR
jgi:ribose-phosphate pyrophosphokinase